MACSYDLLVGRQKRARNIFSLSDMQTSDLEQGDAHLRTKQSIAKLMSDAERQYVAEYTLKSPQTSQTGSLFEGSKKAEAEDNIKVQRLNEGPGNSVGERYLLPALLYSIKLQSMK